MDSRQHGTAHHPSTAETKGARSFASWATTQRAPRGSSSQVPRREDDRGVPLSPDETGPQAQDLQEGAEKLAKC